MRPDINWNPSNKELRTFGLVILIGFGLIGTVVFFKGNRPAAQVLWGFCGTVGALALLLPRASLPFYWAWMGLALVLGRISSFVVLSFIFYLIFTPVGLAMRLLGRDALRLKKTSTPDENSYFLDHPVMKDKRAYERLF